MSAILGLTLNTDSGSLSVQFEELALSVSSPTTGIVGLDVAPPPSFTSTDPITAEATGGVPPYSYSWSSTGSSFLTSPSSQTTQFVAQPIPPGEAFFHFICTVTDAQNSTAQAVFTFTILSGFGVTSGGF